MTYKEEVGRLLYQCPRADHGRVAKWTGLINPGRYQPKSPDSPRPRTYFDQLVVKIEQVYIDCLRGTPPSSADILSLYHSVCSLTEKQWDRMSPHDQTIVQQYRTQLNHALQLSLLGEQQPTHLGVTVIILICLVALLSGCVPTKQPEVVTPVPKSHLDVSGATPNIPTASHLSQEGKPTPIIATIPPYYQELPTENTNTPVAPEIPNQATPTPPIAQYLDQSVSPEGTINPHVGTGGAEIPPDILETTIDDIIGAIEKDHGQLDNQSRAVIKQALIDGTIGLKDGYPAGTLRLNGQDITIEWQPNSDQEIGAGVGRWVVVSTSTAKISPTAPITATAELAPPVIITATLDAANGYFNQNPLPLALTRGPKQVSARHNFYAPAGTLSADEPVTLIGRNDQSSWVELRRADGSTGWAMGHIFMQNGQKVDKAAIEQLPVVEAPEPTTAERINMITFSGFSLGDEAFVRATLLEMVEGDQAGRLHIPLTLAEFQAAPPLSDSSRARLLAVEALQDLPADLRNASSWEIFRWHWQNQFGFPVEMVFEGYTREDGVVIVPPLRETLLGGTYEEDFEDGLTINYAQNRPDRPLVMWQVQSRGLVDKEKGINIEKDAAFVFLTDQIIDEARYGNRDQQLIFKAAFGKELWSVAVMLQLQELSEASGKGTGGPGFRLDHARLDHTRMTANISHLLVYRTLTDNGYPDDNYTDFYLDTAHDLLVLLRDYPLN